MLKDGVLKFISELNLFEAIVLVGNLHQHMGFSKNEKIYFHPEEALFLYIHAKYKLLDYDDFEMISCVKYKIFDYLKSHGYILMKPNCIYNNYYKENMEKSDWLLWNPNRAFSKVNHKNPDKILFVVNPDNDILNGKSGNEKAFEYPNNSLIAINEENCFQFLEINNFSLENENGNNTSDNENENENDIGTDNGNENKNSLINNKSC